MLKLKSAKRNIAWILLCLNVLSVMGGISNGRLEPLLYSGTAGAIKLIGYFLPAIIALVIFVIDGKRNIK